jgi:hypothetical protein
MSTKEFMNVIESLCRQAADKPNSAAIVTPKVRSPTAK